MDNQGGRQNGKNLINFLYTYVLLSSKVHVYAYMYVHMHMCAGNVICMNLVLACAWRMIWSCASGFSATPLS